MKKDRKHLLYIIAVFILLLIPFAGMSFWATNETAEKTKMVPFPQVMKDGKLNVNFFTGLGNYFEDHFAFREYFVTANAKLRGEILGSGAGDDVIIGKNDWLYYNGVIDDFLGKEQLTDRQLYMIARNLKQMQQYCLNHGSQFLFAAPPNKSSVYPENMPDRYLKSDSSNYSRLFPILKDEGVHAIDLQQIFSKESDQLYYKRDTHWNNQGAMLAYQKIMEAFDLPHETYLNVPAEKEQSHLGDIDIMRYPKAAEAEETTIYPEFFDTADDVTDYMAPWIETSNAGKTNQLLMYRDSFGEQLLPFMAGEFQQSFFTRYVPYNLLDVKELQPTHVVIERAERTLPKLLEDISIMEGVPEDIKSGPQIETNSAMDVKKSGDYYLFTGTADKDYIKEKTCIYLTVRDAKGNSSSYEAMYVKKKDTEGYQLYLSSSQLLTDQVHISVAAVTGDDVKIVLSRELNLPEIKEK